MFVIYPTKVNQNLKTIVNMFFALIITFVFSIVTILIPVSVSAQSYSSQASELEQIIRGPLYQDIEQAICDIGGSSVPAGATDDDYPGRVWTFLSSKSLTAEQIAGVLGNLGYESGSYELDPAALEGGSGVGYGLAQWSFDRRDALEAYAQEAGVPVSDFQIQLEYLWHELETSEKAALEDLRLQNSVEDATKSFMLKFERPGVLALDKRIDLANQYFDEYQGTTGGFCVGLNSSGVYGWDLSGPNTMVYYAQTDSRWKSSPFGTSTIGRSGCGPTSVAMVVATLTKNQTITPETIASKYSSYYVPGSGSKWTLFTDATKDYGLTANDIGSDFKSAEETLRNGGLVIISVGEGTFTSEGHIMVIRKVSEDGGTFYIADPYSEAGRTDGESNTKGYTIEELMVAGNLSNMWSVNAN